MPTPFIDLPMDMWEVVAHALPDAGSAGTRDRFALALTCKEMWSYLVDSPVGGAWMSLSFAAGRRLHDSVAARARAVRSLDLFVLQMNRDATVRLLQCMGRNFCKLALEYLDPNVLTSMVENASVVCLVARLDSLSVRRLPTASFLHGATLSRLAFSGPFPADLPVLPSLVWLGLKKTVPQQTLFSDAKHAKRAARALPQLAFLQNDLRGDRVGPHFSTFVRLLAASLKQMAFRNHIVEGEGLSASDLHTLALTDVTVTHSRRDNARSDLQFPVGVLPPQTLTRLVFKTDRSFFVTASEATWSAFHNLRHLDLRGVDPRVIEGHDLTLVARVPVPPLPKDSLPSLRTLLLGFTTNVDPQQESNMIDVTLFARWNAAPRLAVLVVERAIIIATQSAQHARNLMTALKSSLLSVHLHGCSIGVHDKASRVAAVAALLDGRERVCQCAVGECLFGQEWWEEDRQWDF